MLDQPAIIESETEPDTTEKSHAEAREENVADIEVGSQQIVLQQQYEEEEDDWEGRNDGSDIDDIRSENSDSSGSSSDDEDEEELPTAENPFPGFEKVIFKCMPQTHKFRRFCLHLITSPWFERLVILVILLNCLTLGMYQPCRDAHGCTDTRCRVLAVFDHVIYGFFVLEMLIKVFAMGFLGKKGYLAETWNRLDMFIIIAGAAEYGLQNGDINLSAIRTIRVLRPLRAINRIPNLRILVMLLLDTLPMLGNVLLICFFVFFIFGILGVQLWAGMLRQRCYMPENMTQFIQNVSDSYNITNPISEYYRGDWTSVEFICSMPDDSGMLTCGDIEPLVNEASQACLLPFTAEVLDPDYLPPDNGSCVNYNQYYTDCKPNGPNPFEQSISFDNIASAWIAIFQVISLEGWVDIMYFIQDVHTYWVWVYFLALIVIGSFFMVNLFLVVIATQFSETKRRETEKIAEERKRYKSSTTLTSTKTESDGCYNQLLKYVIHLVRRRYRQAKRAYNSWKEKRRKNNSESEVNDTNMADIRLNVFGNHIHCEPCYHVIALMESSAAPIASPEPSDIDSVSYIGLPRYLNASPRFFRRSGRTSPLPEPRIIISGGQDETSFYSPACTDSSSNNLSSQQNGGLKVLVNANEGPENTALLQVLPTHMMDGQGTKSLSTGNSRSSSPVFQRRKGHPPSSPHSTHGTEISNGHKKIWRSRSHDGRITPANNHLSVPTNNMVRGNASPVLSNRLMIPGEAGSTYSVGSRGSSNPACTPLDSIPGELANGGISIHNSMLGSLHGGGGKSSNVFQRSPLGDGQHRYSFSQLSYMQGGCDLVCSECQHLCREYQKQERAKAQEQLKETTAVQRFKEKLQNLRARMKVIVNGNIFRNFILISILINTVTMGVEHHDQPPLLTNIVEYSNYVFIGIFTLEMIFKIMAEGFLHYVKDAFNVFDGFIVIMSYVEIGMGGENSGLSVLRTFRLLRILKLIRFLPALQRQFVVMVRTLDNVASFFGLLMLFMFIFSVLGMNLFGCLFCDENEYGERVCSRRNFDSLLWSLITVFQILTQEDWNTIMYDGMSRTTPWAALYFVALMTIGNYVLFNLLVAILVEGFSSVAKKRLENFLRKRDEKLTKRGAVSTTDMINAQMSKNDGEDDEAVQQQDGMGGALPSIITDHTGENRELRIKMPPLITHTEATPRGSPKSETPMPSPSARVISLDDQTDWDNQSNNSFNPFLNSPSLHSRRSNSSSPKLSRKCSNSLKGRRSQREDKVSLMEAEFEYEQERREEEVNTSRQTLDSDSRSRNSSIRNFDLLQVPGREPLQSTTSETATSLINFDMDQSNDDKSNNNISVSGSMTSMILGPLSLQIPDQNIVPNSPQRMSNGSVGNHSPNTARLNGGPTASGEHTPLLVASPNQRNGYKQNHVSPHEMEQKLDGVNNKKSKSIHSSVYSPLNEADEMEKQFPYSDHELADEDKPEQSDGKKTFFQKVLHTFRPRGCLITRADYSLYILAPTNPVRRFCKWLSSRKWFDYCILVLIGLNCITLAVERPSIPKDSIERQVLTNCNYAFTGIFFVEMTIKIIARGFVIGAHTYLRDGWNINDGFLVLVSTMDVCLSLTLAGSPKIFGVLRVLRLLRALRPLRVISRAPGLKLVVETLLSSLRPIGNIVLICLTFFLIFGILGVQLFRGTFYHCEGENLRNVTNRTQCLEHGYEWKNWKYNFDDLGNALMSLFVLSSKDGWVTIMYQGLDAVGLDQQPIENYAEWRLLYFISFLLLVGFFVLNMFVGVVVENFHKCREAHEKEERQKREQRRLRKLAKKISTVDPLAPLMNIVQMETAKADNENKDADDEDEKKKKDNDSSSVSSSTDSRVTYGCYPQRGELNMQPFYMEYGKRRMFIYKIVTNKFFDIAVSLIIFLNVISMAVEHYQMSDEMLFSLKIMNYVFTFIFMLEALVKIVAYGFVRYIKERWNQLDTLIVVLSLVGIVLEEVQTEVIPINPTIMRVMRILRIARVLKLLKVAKGIRALLDTVLVALPQVGNLGLLFFLLFFIFAALGVELFGRIECSTKNPCEGMGVHANFENSGYAFLTLFRIATGDNWNGIMKDALRTTCDDNVDCERNCCVNKVITPIYFVVFVLTAQFVLVNVVVAVLMKHLEDAHFSVEDILYGRRMALQPLSPEGHQLLLAAHNHRLEHPGSVVDNNNLAASSVGPAASDQESSFYDKSRKKYLSKMNKKQRAKRRKDEANADDGQTGSDKNIPDNENESSSEEEEEAEDCGELPPVPDYQISPKLNLLSKTKSELKLNNNRLSSLPKHKPLCKHVSLPSNFKVHPSVLESTS